MLLVAPAIITDICLSFDDIKNECIDLYVYDIVYV